MSLVDRAPDPALVERFRADVARVRPLGTDERMAVAVSGGPDSMALLALAAAAFPGRVVAATVDHRLRAASADEARMVGAWCGANAISHVTLVVDDTIGTRDVQARARDRRYALLCDWVVQASGACLATAHHADDQAETFLMRAARGSGVAGLSGIRGLQRLESIDLIRPLLGWRVTELRALALALALPFIDDPSNVDPHYDRTRFRALLQSTPWLDPVQIARSATFASEADATIREIEAWLWGTRATTRLPGLVAGATDFQDSRSPNTRPSGCRDVPAMTGKGKAATEILLDTADLPRELKRRLSRKAIHAVRAAAAIVRPAFTDATNIEPLLDSLEAGDAATQAGIRVGVHANIWHFALQPPRRTL